MTTYPFLIDYYRELPFLIKLIGGLIVVSLILIVVLTIFLKGIRKYQRKKQAEIVKFKNEYEIMFIEYLYADDHKEVKDEENSFMGWLDLLGINPSIRDENRIKLEPISQVQQSIISKLKAQVLIKSK